MEKEYKIKETDLVKLKEYLGEIPHKYAVQLEGFLFNDKVLEEIKEEQENTEEKQDDN